MTSTAVTTVITVLADKGVLPRCTDQVPNTCGSGLGSGPHIHSSRLPPMRVTARPPTTDRMGQLGRFSNGKTTSTQVATLMSTPTTTAPARTTGRLPDTWLAAQ